MSVYELKNLFSEYINDSLYEHHKNEPIIVDETLLKVDEVAEYLGVSKVTIHTWKRKGKIPFHRLGRKVYF